MQRLHDLSRVNRSAVLGSRAALVGVGGREVAAVASIQGGCADERSVTINSDLSDTTIAESTLPCLAPAVPASYASQLQDVTHSPSQYTSEEIKSNSTSQHQQQHTTRTPQYRNRASSVDIIQSSSVESSSTPTTSSSSLPSQSPSSGTTDLRHNNQQQQQLVGLPGASGEETPAAVRGAVSAAPSSRIAICSPEEEEEDMYDDRSASVMASPPQQHHHHHSHHSHSLTDQQHINDPSESDGLGDDEGMDEEQQQHDVTAAAAVEGAVAAAGGSGMQGSQHSPATLASDRVRVAESIMSGDAGGGAARSVPAAAAQSSDMSQNPLTITRGVCHNNADNGTGSSGPSEGMQPALKKHHSMAAAAAAAAAAEHEVQSLSGIQMPMGLTHVGGLSASDGLVAPLGASGFAHGDALQAANEAAAAAAACDYLKMEFLHAGGVLPGGGMHVAAAHQLGGHHAHHHHHHPGAHLGPHHGGGHHPHAAHHIAQMAASSHAAYSLAAAAASMGQHHPQLHGFAELKSAVGRKKGQRLEPVPQSGFKGVSWNSRMKAWLAFYVTENGERKSKTFSTRKLGMEEARMQAITFCKEKQDSRREARKKNREMQQDRGGLDGSGSAGSNLDKLSSDESVADSPGTYYAGASGSGQVGNEDGTADAHHHRHLSHGPRHDHQQTHHIPHATSNGDLQATSQMYHHRRDFQHVQQSPLDADGPDETRHVAGSLREVAYVPIVPIDTQGLVKKGLSEPLELTVLPPCQYCAKQPYPFLMLVADGKEQDYSGSSILPFAGRRSQQVTGSSQQSLDDEDDQETANRCKSLPSQAAAAAALGTDAAGLAAAGVIDDASGIGDATGHGSCFGGVDDTEVAEVSAARHPRATIVLTATSTPTPLSSRSLHATHQAAAAAVRTASSMSDTSDSMHSGAAPSDASAVATSPPLPLSPIADGAGGSSPHTSSCTSPSSHGPHRVAMPHDVALGLSTMMSATAHRLEREREEQNVKIENQSPLHE